MSTTSKNLKTILLVDDDSSMLDIIEYFLSDTGFRVYKAKNGETALKIFLEKKPDLILSDLNMPGMSGYQLLEIFQNESPHTPVVILSAASDVNDAKGALRLGACDYIIKPFNQADLEKTLNRVLNNLH